MSEETDLVLVLTTVASVEESDRLANVLIDRSLVACVQIDGPIRSRYRWNGKIEDAQEYRLLLKTTRLIWPRLKRQLAELHPYDEPEIVMLDVADVSDGYRKWVVDETR